MDEALHSNHHEVMNVINTEMEKGHANTAGQEVVASHALDSLPDDDANNNES